MSDKTKCRLEEWSSRKNDWSVRHAGIDLLHPQRYLERLAANGKIGRVTIVETGEILQLQEPPEPCGLCGDRHVASKVEGECLI